MVLLQEGSLSYVLKVKPCVLIRFETVKVASASLLQILWHTVKHLSTVVMNSAGLWLTACSQTLEVSASSLLVTRITFSLLDVFLCRLFC